MEAPSSSDAFVVLPPLTKRGVVFGKNSGRPHGEVQEVVHLPAAASPDPVQCTQVAVPAAGATRALALSRPGWAWGAEMGANECGVAIGCGAVRPRDAGAAPRLLGADLVRLGLERGADAAGALAAIVALLERHGQGHDSFLIADPRTAWVLEAAGRHWAAVEVTSGYRNISNALTITTRMDRRSEGIEEYAKAEGLWDGVGEFNFCHAFSGVQKPDDARLAAGGKLLEKYTKNGGFRETDMFAILRDKDSDICRGSSSAFPTQGSQVSTLTADIPSVHWFTATPDPSISVFKPFIFSPFSTISQHTICPASDKSAPHTLYALHAKAKGNNVQELLRKMEADCVKELETVLESVGDDLSEFDELLKDCVETEVKFYR